MSYILDALRKAEAERERGQLPGLHSAVATARLPERRLLEQVPPGWPVLAGLGTLVVVGAAAGWALMQRGSADGASADSGAAAATMAAPVTSPLPKRTTVAAVPEGSAMPATPPPRIAAVSTPPAPAAVPSPSLVSPAASLGSKSAVTSVPASAVASRDSGLAAPALGVATQPAAAQMPSNVSSPTSVVAASATAPPTLSAASAAPAAGPPSDGRILAVDDLPAEIRRELPKLDFGGLVQLENPPRRSLIVNGAILMEGELVQPNLVLEQIRLTGAVLRYKGWRFQLPL